MLNMIITISKKVKSQRDFFVICWWRKRIPSAPCTNDIMIGPMSHLIWLGLTFFGLSAQVCIILRHCYFQNLSHWIWLGITFYWLLTQVSFREVVLNQRSCFESEFWISSWVMGLSHELNLFNSWLKPLSKELTQNHLTTRVDPQALIEIDSWLERFRCRGYFSNFNCVPKPNLGHPAELKEHLMRSVTVTLGMISSASVAPFLLY